MRARIPIYLSYVPDDPHLSRPRSAIFLPTHFFALSTLLGIAKQFTNLNRVMRRSLRFGWRLPVKEVLDNRNRRHRIKHQSR